MTLTADDVAAIPHSMATAIEQIAKCGFECEAGPLANNVGWQWLTAAAKVGPEFWPGQGVWFEVEATAAGKTLKQFVNFYIVGCHMDANTESRFWTYDLSYDPPAPRHYGEVHFRKINGSKLHITKPELAVSA